MEKITTEYNINGEIEYDDDNWTDFIEDIATMMRQVDKNNNNKWLIEGKNMGWQNRSGSKLVDTDDALTLIRAITPNAECTYKATYDSPKFFEIILSHHDSPTGEFYKVSERK